MKKESSTFCIFPWEQLATLTNGHIVPCCVAEDDNTMSLHSQTFKEAWNSTTMKTIRRKMIRGEKVDACHRCYAEESYGVDSYRMQNTENFRRSLGGSFEILIESTAEDGYFGGPINSIDLRLGNNCNLQCVMCRPWESSKWAAEINNMIENTEDETLRADLRWKAALNKPDFLWHKNPNFWKTFQNMVPEIREITIGGGEPFLIPEQIQFLRDCVARGHAKTLSLKYHTNATLLPDEALELFSHFHHVNLMLSIDGLNEQNFYMRYPAKWDDIVANLNKLENSPNSVSVHLLSTMHIMSLYYFPNLLRWIMQQNFRKVSVLDRTSNLPFTGLVHHPSYINPQILPKNIKASIRRKYQELYANDFVTFFKDAPELKSRAEQRLSANLDFMDAEDRVNEFEQFKAYIKTLDKSRNTDFAKTFPELYSEMTLK